MSVIRILGEGYYGVEASGVSIRPDAFDRISRAFSAAIDRPIPANVLPEAKNVGLARAARPTRSLEIKPVKAAVNKG